MRVDPANIVLFFEIVWGVVALIVIGYPLLTGRMRFGGADSEPITRDGDPGAFWTAYAISTGIFLALSGGVAWLVATKLP